ncbi:barstar family protein [Streptomyces sp. NPDC087294]|uniref:barstar family protein n=1 Tax=Streptomyces sp. NPDC087294 TaxID=3365777 RepID=UPI003814E38D
MTNFDITETSEPWVIFVPQGMVEVHRQLSVLEAKGGRVHRFDSRDLMTAQGVYRSFAETLQFPDYFGMNWDAVVDCLDSLCGAVTGSGVGMAAVVHDADPLLDAEHLPLFVSVLCQGADRANSAVDLDGFAWDRPAMPEHFVFEFRDFDSEKIALRVEQQDLTITRGNGFIAAALNPDEWH